MLDIMAFVVAAILYAGALYVGWQQRLPVFVSGVISGQVGVLAAPLWAVLYQSSYQETLSRVGLVLGQPFVVLVFLAGTWYFTLPGLVLVAVYAWYGWQPRYLQALLVFAAVMLYHVLLESTALNMGLWQYASQVTLPFNISHALISTAMSAVISFAGSYVLLLVARAGTSSLLYVALPAFLLLAVLVRGILGAPFWLMLQAAPTAPPIVTLATLVTLLLLAWAVHIVAGSFARLHRNYAA